MAAKTPHLYADSSQRELKGLTHRERPALRTRKICTIPKSARIYDYRWVDKIKNISKNELDTPVDDPYRKSILCSRNFRDSGTVTFPLRAPTVSNTGFRIMLALAASFPAKNVFLYDVQQIFTQSKSSLERDVYMRAPPELNLPNRYILQVLESLYGFSEGAHPWHLNSDDHHRSRFGMKATRNERCLFFWRDLNGFWLISLKVYDGCETGSPKC